MADNKLRDKSGSSDQTRQEDTTTKQTPSPTTGTNDEKRMGDAAGQAQRGGQTTEDMVRRQGSDSANEPES